MSGASRGLLERRAMRPRLLGRIKVGIKL